MVAEEVERTEEPEPCDEYVGGFGPCQRCGYRRQVHQKGDNSSEQEES